MKKSRLKLEGKLLEMECYFDKKDTNSLKGILLILMFVLHLFCYPSWYVWEGYPRLLWMEGFQGHFQICVAGFTFLTGYLYFFSDKKSLLHIARKYTSILIPYWIVFGMLLFFALITRTYYGSLFSVLSEAFVLDGSVMVFNWYVRYYLLMLIALYVMVKFINNDAILWLMSLIGSLALYYGIEYLFPNNSVVSTLEKFSVYYPITMTGYIFAKNRIFETLHSLVKGNKNRVLIAILFVVFVFMQPSWLYGIDFNNIIWQMFRKCIRIISIPFFIWGWFVIIRMLNSTILNRVLYELGKYSLLMWFLHGIFFNCSKQIFQKIVFLPYYPVLVLVWGLLVCYCISVPLNYIVVIFTRKIRGALYKRHA